MISRRWMLVFVAAIFVGPHTSRGDILFNGSFELPGFIAPPDFRLLSNGDTSISGWTAHDDGVGEPPYWALIGGGNPSAPYLGFDGRYSVYLNAGSSIETTFAAVAGTTYNLSFWSKTDGTRDLAEYQPLSVSVAGASTTLTAPAGTQSFTFTAALTDPNAQLKFSNNSSAGDYKIYAIDYANINVVPEPTGCLIWIASGVYFYSAHSRSRRRY